MTRMLRLLALGALTIATATSALASSVYVQTFAADGVATASQNDTTGGNGNFATTYDNFTLGSSSAINQVHFSGGYFNPPNQAPITGFTIQFYADAGGQPGASIYSAFISGTAGETSLGSFGGFPFFSYSALLSTAFDATAGTQYWMSVVPDLGFPPQWGWADGTGGDGTSYQDFLGTRSVIGSDMAFELDGNPLAPPIPEPSSIVLLGSGILGLAGAARRKFNV